MSYNKHGSFLKGMMSYRVAEGVTSSAIHSFLMSLDCPRALTVWLLFSNNEHVQLSELTCNPGDYENVTTARDAYVATCFLSKYVGLNLPFDLNTVAFEKFERFELLCKQTNSRFRNLLTDPKYQGPVVWLHHAVTRKIQKILGEFCARELFESPDWGPGASTMVRRREASPAKKFQLEAGITRDLYNLFPIEVFAEVYPLWADHLLELGFPKFEVGNKVTTVPKNSKTNRVIAIEPGINLWFQLSVGEMISRRLARYGVDTHDQTRNQRLAYEGSKSNSLATIDLSSASDSVSLEVVRQLLPPDWFEAMDCMRDRKSVV